MDDDILDGEIEYPDGDDGVAYVPGLNLGSINHQKQEIANRRRLIVINYMRMGIRNHAEILKKLREDHGIIVSQPTISHDLKMLDAEYKMRVANRIDEERAIDFDRIEVAIGALMKKICDDVAQNANPDLNTIRTLTPLLERKAKMLGYDSPLKVDIRELIIESARKAGIDEEIALQAAGQLTSEM
jgi:hypothetical protein